MSAGGFGKYQQLCESDPAFSEWIGPDLSDPSRFRCRPCGISLMIAKMCVTAIQRHVSTEKHLAKLEKWKKIQSTNSFFAKK